jgi:hypothetical protein
VATVANKLGPLWEATAELLRNKDFYGAEIRHKDDHAIQQLVEVGEWAAKQAIPFAFSSAGKLLEQRGAQDTLMSMIQAGMKHHGDVLAGQLGFTPAPSFIQNSEALNKARAYDAGNAPPGTRTKEASERMRAKYTIEDMYRSGKVDKDAIHSMMQSGVISEPDRFSAQLAARENPLAAATKRLHVDQAVNVFMAASPEEQKLLRPVIETKQREIDTFTNNPEERQKLKDAYRNALHPQPKFSTEKPQA